MHINIKATGMDLTPALSEYVNKKITLLEEKYFQNESPDIVAQVEVGRITEHHKSGDVYRAEVHINGGGYDLYVATEEEDLYASIDKAKDELERVITSTKNKSQTLAIRGGRMIKNIMKGFRKENE